MKTSDEDAGCTFLNAVLRNAVLRRAKIGTVLLNGEGFTIEFGTEHRDSVVYALQVLA